MYPIRSARRGFRFGTCARLTAIAIALVLSLGLGHAQAGVQLRLVGSYDSGAGAGAAEIAAFDAVTGRLAVVNATHGGVDILDLADPARPTLVRRIDLSSFGASANSVAAAKGVIAVAVEAAAADAAGKVVFLNGSGAVLGSVAVGVLPDMLTFTPDGTRVLVANEGEPSADYSIDPEGSISIIDLRNGVAGATVTQVGFAAFNSKADSLRSVGVRLYGPGASVAQDLEPEYIAVSPDGATAFVSLQENNALAIVNLSTAALTRIAPLGYKDHSLPGQGLDASNRDDGIDIRTWPVLGMYQPDALAAYSSGGQVFVVTANEGDARDYETFTEDARIGDLELDPVAFPEADALLDNANLGRLKTTTALGDLDGDGDHDRIYTYGARSFSIRNSAGVLVYDSGDALERVTAAYLPEGYNSDAGMPEQFDERSDDKGPEPEGLALGQIGGRTYAFVGLERTGGVAVYDITVPTAPVFSTYYNPRDFGAQTGHISPEGVVFIPAADSPSGGDLLVLAHEVSGTVAVLEVNQPEPLALTVLHNNDGESQLLDAGQGLEDFGGVARFKTLVDQLRAEAGAEGRTSLLLSSGDNFLAGPEFSAGLAAGTYFDAVALDLLGYDAIALGNHDFDFGPEVLAEFIGAFSSFIPYLSANLDFSAEPDLAVLAATGRIAGSAIIQKDGHTIGVVGATTPALAYISSPRHVGVGEEVAEAVQAQIDALAELGIDKIILISHLQSIDNDLELIPMLRGVDVAIAGGGDELLANAGDRLVPVADGSLPAPYGPYPLEQTDADGVTVPVITTEGDYRYVGRLEVDFDAAGRVVDYSGGPVRVAGGSQPDAVDADQALVQQVVEPVEDAVAGLAAKVVGASQVALDGQRTGVRSQETNEGNLIADALLWQGRELAAAFGVKAPDVALQNGGGIRNASLVPAGPITELTTINMVPFANFAAIVPQIRPRQFKEILENAVSRVEFGDGRFAQVAGFSFTWDPEGQAQVLDAATGKVTTPGQRVVNVTLDNGRQIVRNGVVVAGAPSVSVATIDFLARGGDQYPFAGAPFVSLGVTYQQALAGYIREGLGGSIAAADYPAGGEGRITKGAAAVDGRLEQRVRVRLTMTRDGAPVAGTEVAFSRSVAGRPPEYVWKATTDGEGQAVIEIVDTKLPTASGMYQARALLLESETPTSWHSIPLNGGSAISLALPVGGKALVTEQTPLAAAREEVMYALPEVWSLGQAYPNPFNSSTQIRYSAAAPGEARLVVYSLLGQQVRVLHQGFVAAGQHVLAWDGRDDSGRAVSSGVYYLHLVHPAGKAVARVLLLK